MIERTNTRTPNFLFSSFDLLSPLALSWIFFILRCVPCMQLGKRTGRERRSLRGCG
ncbi:hypothetical protein P167DRAFT_247344 [Morchella conica CCBAS932]|uniref:Uncharacterized protein n=1 Tax=Morchella conica CCBAS932 TaxID=1392247 RepID=A0A3N4KM94_9PEZI|nr:hypothetical protein P167DRAFT_247344 [Morchella conica CCBAS932]